MCVKFLTMRQKKNNNEEEEEQKKQALDTRNAFNFENLQKGILYFRKMSEKRNFFHKCSTLIYLLTMKKIQKKRKT